MTFITEVDPVVTEGSLLAEETSKEEQLKAAAERINNAELTEGELDESMAPEHYEASDLRVLEGLEAVRIRPGMYIGSTGPRGLHHLVYEIVDNSVDEALAGYASHIEVTILPDNGIRVVDDGRGIPVDEVPGEGVSGVETVMTKLHAGGKFGGGGYAVSGGLHGVGISVVNALSTHVDIEVRRQGFHWTQTYVDQHPVAPLKQGEPMAEGESTGTSVTFWADPKIFETTIYDFETLRSRFQQMAFLNKGLKLSLTDERVTDQAGDEVAGDAEGEPGEKHQTVTYQYLNGIKDYVDYLVKVRKATPVEEDVISFEAEDLKLGISAELAMQWTTAYSEAVHTFANTISTTEGGTHEEGFRAALTSLVNRYARDKAILKDKDENLSGDDVREGLTAVISVKLTNPQFEGQTKTKLGNSEAKTFVQRVMTDKVRYHKVIIMADADVDGAHIATLNLTLFFRYMRPMITAGYVYVAMPPLYRLKWTKGPHDFVYTDAERDRVLAEGKANGRQLPKGEGIQRYKGLGEMSYQELWETTMDPEHRILKQVHIEDAAAADETFSMLMGDEVEPRRLFIQRNAKNVRWIDA